MVLGAIGRINNANLKKKSSKWLNCARCVYQLSEITTYTGNFKITALLDLQSNPPKRPQSAANDVEGVEYCQLHHSFSRVASILHDSWLTIEFLSPSMLQQ